MGANICQVKVNGDYNRRIGSSSKAKYYVNGVCVRACARSAAAADDPEFKPAPARPSGATLDVDVPSDSTCGRQRSKTVSSTITFECSPSAGVGIPEFRHETDECQYLFVWHTDAICVLT